MSECPLREQGHVVGSTYNLLLAPLESEAEDWVEPGEVVFVKRVVVCSRYCRSWRAAAIYEGSLRF